MGKCQQKLQEIWRNLVWLGMICQYAAYARPTAEFPQNRAGVYRTDLGGGEEQLPI